LITLLKRYLSSVDLQVSRLMWRGVI